MTVKNDDAGAPAPAAAAAAPDEIKNLKAEMNRKLDNTTAQLAAVLERLNKTAAPAPAAAPKVTAPSVFDDEEGFANSIVEKATSAITRSISQQQEDQAKTNAVIQAIYREYPETADETGPLMVRAKEIYAAMSVEERASAASMRASVAEAAAEQGIKPKSKRATSDDSFSVGASGQGRREQRGREADLDPATIAFAKAMGKDVTDPKYIEKLKAAAKRTRWNKYE